MENPYRLSNCSVSIISIYIKFLASDFSRKLRYLPEIIIVIQITGTKSSNDRLILCQNMETNSNEYFSYDICSRIKFSTMWNVNATVQSPRKMSFELRSISNTINIWFIMVNQTTQGLYSMSGKTSYHQNLWSLSAARLRFRLLQSPWNLKGTPMTVLLRCLSNFRVIRSI